MGSKQERVLVVKNNEPIEISMSEAAVEHVFNSREAKPKQEPKEIIPEPEPSPPKPAEIELKLSSELHEKRIANYEQNMLKSFKESSKEVTELFKDRYQTAPVCFDLQKLVSECYKENSKLPLKCSEVAEKYMKCVEEERQSRLGLISAAKRKSA